ncbi:MAG TPA: cysteine peptidase family C39 domain-containing protein, partial [Holophagaceae bacterium]|nr:cysteine peptidase family C39 domain-containing protein [Holophagaceae bacterium]
MILPRPLFRRRRVPYIPQMEAVECGAASLAMLLAHYGHHAPLSEVREACGVSRDGATALGILRAAEGYGLEAQAVSLELPALRDLPLPAILHWNFAHFLVLERLTPEGAILVDPASGRIHARQAELSRSFTGVALAFSPGDAFEPRAGRGPSLTRYARLLRRWAPSLGQVLGASLMLQMVGMLFPVASQVLIDRVLAPKQEPWLWGLGLGLALAVAGRALLTLLRSWVVQTVQAAMDLTLMEQFIGHMLHLPLSFFHQRRPGDLMQRVQSNSTVRNLFSSRSISALLDGFLLLGYTALMLAYSPALGGLLLLLAGVRIAVLVALRERNQQIMTSELAASG